MSRDVPLSVALRGSAAAAVLAYLLRGRAAPTPVLDGIDAALHPVLRRALHHDPAQRYPDAAAFLSALEQDATRRYGPAWWTQTGLAALVEVDLRRQDRLLPRRRPRPRPRRRR